MPASILVVEDELHPQELISYALQGAGHRVRAVSSGEAAIRAVEADAPDLVVLDVRLPGMDGWEVCRQIRARGSTPILFLSALGDEDSVVRGLRLGGDDYLPKPFSPAVLVARVEALLRRARLDASHQTVRLRGLTIDLARVDVRRGDELVHLTATEFRLLAALARNPGQVMSSRDLLRVVHGREVGRYDPLEIVKVHVRHIRRKIEPDPEHPRYLLNVRGLGYMLNGEELEPA